MKHTLLDHFIPHERNRHTPHLLKHRALFGYSIGLVMLKVAIMIVAVSFPAALVFSSAITAANIIALTNANRSTSGLSALSENARLDAAAQAKADNMLIEQYFAHTSPTGQTPWDWLRQAGYAYTLAGENLAIHYKTSEDTTAGWLASPTHRANIMNERFSEIGVGVAMGTFDGFDTTVVVQMFGEPRDTGQATETRDMGQGTTVVEPAPEPEPEPVVTEPVTVPTETNVLGEELAPPVVKTETANVTPTAEGYAVKIAVENATEVRVQAGTEMTELAPPTEPDSQVWSGTLLASAGSITSGNEVVYAVARAEDGSQVTEPIAVAAKTSNAAEMYAPDVKAKPDVKLFGVFPVLHLDQTIGKVYFFTIVFLGVLLLVSMLAKFEHHKHSVTAHALLVIVLAGALAVL